MQIVRRKSENRMKEAVLIVAIGVRDVVLTICVVSLFLLAQSTVVVLRLSSGGFARWLHSFPAPGALTHGYLKKRRGKEVGLGVCRGHRPAKYQAVCFYTGETA